MKPLQCPKCLGRLEPVIHAGIEVDRCITCKGIWFDSLEAEQLKVIQGSESLDIGDPEVGHEFNAVQGDVNCPKCSVTMLRILDIDQHLVWYEKCPQCQGVWLDAGEFKDFKDNFKEKSLLNKVWSVFTKKRQ